MHWWGWLLLIVAAALLCAVAVFFIVNSMWWYYLHHCATCGERGSLLGPLRGWHRGKLQNQRWHCPRHSLSDIEANERRESQKWNEEWEHRHGYSSAATSTDNGAARECSKCHRMVSEIAACKSCAAEFCHTCLGKTIAVQQMTGPEQSVKCLSCGMAFF
jgi:hypothetical protein